MVAGNDQPAALEDLAWLGIEPDSAVASPRLERYETATDELVERGTAYGCYCTSAEMREMSPNPSGWPEAVRYDGRCRRLTSQDRAALASAGRRAAIRLVRGDAQAALTTTDGRTWSDLPDFDFQVLRADGTASPAFALAADSHAAEATHVLVDESVAPDLPLWALIAETFAWELPAIAMLPRWSGPAASMTITELRDAGFLPVAVLDFLLRAGWTPKGPATLGGGYLGKAAKKFAIESMTPSIEPVTIDPARAINGERLRSMGENERLVAVFDYLSRRGFATDEFDQPWRRRFVNAVLGEVQTLGDTEEMASLLFSATVDYDREVARILRLRETQRLIDDFEASFDGIAADDEAAWRDALLRFRSTVATPGRALATLRMVLTGARTGPSLAAFLALLGAERCRSRLNKARRYSATKG